VKIIDLDLQRRRISLSIKQAAEGGEVAEEYREHFGEHAYDAQGNYIGTPITADDADREAAWAEYYNEYGGAPGDNPASPDDQQDADVAAPVEVAVEVEESENASTTRAHRSKDLCAVGSFGSFRRILFF
jgi:small subunit ribosomal protein S1